MTVALKLIMVRTLTPLDLKTFLETRLLASTHWCLTGFPGLFGLNAKVDSLEIGQDIGR